ncbi:hypothetical protein [uncultured Paraburkholderia sp.]|uniref:hypothetical protein n=1 Tax=uncultured Paraburkholderia sp. TaxID=1822466 RepID=UPI002595F608|nr:hypothetical protein [uncultured Paraburkholderia sp.]
MRRLKARLTRLHTTRGRFPVLLQLRGNQTIIGGAGSVAAFCERGFVSGLLQLKLDDPPLLVLLSIRVCSASKAASIAIGSTTRMSSFAIATLMHSGGRSKR